ncbi:nuclease-related domain-containing protein [Nonomuraea wenchangensis]
MTRMIPPFFDPKSTSPGEREVFERLRDDPATEGWMALHSLGVAEHPRQIQGEVDFVILVPDVGVLCLEVKSHQRVERLQDGRWLLGSHPPEVRGPFKQSDEAKFAVAKHLRKATPPLPPLPIASGVCFTHARFRAPNPTEWHSWQSIDAVAFHRLPVSALVLRILKYHREHLATTPSSHSWFSPGSLEPTAATCARIANFLRPSFEFTEPPKIRRYRREEEAEHFTRQQYRVLDMFAENPRCVVKGAAGTGKTFVALEAARRLAAEGSRVLLCCYNKLLGQWLKDEAADQELIMAGTLHSYMGKLIQIAGKQRTSDSDSHAWYSEQLPEHALDVLLEDEAPRFDALVIDEAQDLMRDAYLDVLDVSLRGGLGSGRWLQFGDFTNQAIYDSGADGIGLLRERTGSRFASVTLSENCRNVPSISQHIEETARLKPGYSGTLRAENDREALREWWSTPEEQQQLLVKHLDRLQRDGFAPDEIVVLSPRGSTSAAATCTHPRWRGRLVPLDAPRGRSVAYGTAHAFKGLDAAAVIVTDIEAVHDEKDQALFYIASSRARDDLTVIARNTARPDFRRLLLGE